MEAEAPPKRSRKRTRSWMSACLLLGILVVVARLLLPDAVGEQVRRSFVEILREHYPGMEVRIAAGRFDPRQGVTLLGLEIRDASLPASAAPILSIERLVVETDWDPAALRDRRAPVTARRILVDGVTANIWPTERGGWSVQPLWPPPEMGPHCPIVMLSGAQLRLCRDWRSASTALVIGGLQAAIHETPAERGGVETQWRIEGGGDFVQHISAVGNTSATGEISAHGLIRHLSVDDRLLRSLPEPLRARVAAARGLSAISDVQWAIAGTVDEPLRDWVAELRVETAKFASPQLPLDIEQLRGTARVRPTGIEIVDSVCSINGSTVRTRGRIDGLHWPCPMEVAIDAENLMLDDSLTSILPDEAQQVNDAIRPRGRVDVHGKIGFHGGDWTIDSDVTCHAISVNVDQFPYPITDLRGVVRYRDGTASTEHIECRAGETRLACSFELGSSDPSDPWWIEFKGDRALRIDDALMQALTPRGEPTSELEEFVRTLSPAGAVHLVRARFDRNATGELSKQLDLEVIDGRMRYAGFPYPLYEVRGRIWVDDRGVQLSHFQAQNNGGAQIQCEGNWIPTPEEPHGKLDLVFRGFEVPLDDSLRTALPPSARQTWDTLAPSGVLEHLEVRVAHGPAAGPPRLAVVAQQWGNASPTRREVSVTPVTLPYRLDITRGVVRMEGDSIVISDLDGYHGSSRVSAEGHCHRRPDGRWQLDMNLLTGSRLRPDSELINSLPTEIRGSFAKLQLREPVSFRGTTQLILPSPEFPVPIFQWNVLLQLEGNRIGDAGPVHDIRGEILVSGQASGENATADGSVRIDSMHINDLQLTNIEGPFQIRGPQLLLGTRHDGGGPNGGRVNSESREIVPIRGKIFGGDVEMQGDLTLSSGQFDVRIGLQKANLSTLLADLAQPHAGLTGQFSAAVHLEGLLGASSLLRGAGTATLSEANLYQMPLIVKVFNQLRLTPAEDVAFTDGSTDFAIDGDLLKFNELQLWGDLVALHGTGTLNGRREIDLVFNTRVSPQNAWSRLVRPLRSQKYTLWTINVHGPVSDPKIERRALDAVGETLERLFPVIERNTEASDSPSPLPDEALQSASRRYSTPRAASTPRVR